MTKISGVAIENKEVTYINFKPMEKKTQTIKLTTKFHN